MYNKKAWIKKLNLNYWGSIASIIGLFIVLTPILIHKSNDGSMNSLKHIKMEGKIKVGYIPYYDLTSRDISSGKIRGFLVDLLIKTLAELNISEESIEFVETDWQNFGIGLRAGKYDLCIAGTFKTPQREKIVNFTEPIFYLGNGALVKKDDNRFNTINSFDKKDITIAVIVGEQGYEYVKENFKYARLKELPGADLSLVCMEVQKGLVDAAFTDQYIINLFVNKNKDVKDALSHKPYKVLPICWSVRKGDSELLKYINDKLSFLNKSGWTKRLKAEYSMIPWAQPIGINKDRISTKNIYLKIFGIGLFYTLLVSFFAILLGLFLGSFLALILASRKQSASMLFLKGFTKTYIYCFLSIPALVLIIIIYYNDYVTGLNSIIAAIIALGINLSPFAARIIASGIENIPRSYLDAALVFGYSQKQIAFKFKLPLVIRNSMQPLLVQIFTTIKLSSLASVIGVTESLHTSLRYIRETYQTKIAYLLLIVCYMIIVLC